MSVNFHYVCTEPSAFQAVLTRDIRT